MKYLLILPIRLYQIFISPMIPPCCRFTPTCSEYFIGALRKHGIFRGSSLGIRRLLRCNPFFEAGHDPVP